jgi:hypothetical protein
MGTAVLQYTADHGGRLPPLFPGQVLEYEAGRGGRVVTECAAYLGLPAEPARYLAVQLLPRAYARLTTPPDKDTLRVYVLNTTVTNRGAVVNPFGRVTTPGQPPTANTTLATLAGAEAAWMMSTADQTQTAVVAAPWKRTPHPDRRSARCARFSASTDRAGSCPSTDLEARAGRAVPLTPWSEGAERAAANLQRCHLAGPRRRLNQPVTTL